jgi:hypothetical protein
MQIIEVSDLGVRSAVLRLTRRDTPLTFEIYPMVHIGEPAFYAAVTERLRRCDLVVAEGVGGTRMPDGSRRRTRGTVAASALTSSYRLPARFARAGLVLQNIPLATLGVPVSYPDMTDEQFSAGWREVPLWQRMLVTAGAPVAGLYQLAFGSRRALARELETTDEHWHDELMNIDSMDELMALLGEKRDRLLIAELDDIHRRRGHEPVTVAVVYGAAHVAPVVYGMRALHGYGLRGAGWLTVFDL